MTITHDNNTTVDSRLCSLWYMLRVNHQLQSSESTNAKDHVYASKMDDIMMLKAQIIQTIEHAIVDMSHVLARVCQDVEYRFELPRVSEGTHVEV